MGKKRSSKLWVTCVSEARSEWMAQSVIDSCTTRWLNSLSAHSFISVSWPLLLSKFGQPSWLDLLPFNWFIHTSRYLKSESIPKWHPISLFCEWIRFFLSRVCGCECAIVLRCNFATLCPSLSVANKSRPMFILQRLWIPYSGLLRFVRLNNNCKWFSVVIYNYGYKPH